MSNTFDAANRLIETERDGTILEPIYNGVNDRVGQTVGLSTTNYALDVAGGLPEVIYTSEGNLYLHLPGVIMAESSTGEIRYLLSDGLGSVRQGVDENGAVVAYNGFDPYGNPNPQSLTPDPYGFTGEWWENEVGLLHLRARWYLPETGTFLSVDPVESEPPYQYVRGNVVNLTDPSGYCVVQYSGEVRMNQFPYGTSGVCPNTVSPLQEGIAAMEEYHEYLEDQHLTFSNPHNRNGYIEGYVESTSLGPCVLRISGEEIVYNFERGESQKFTYREVRLSDYFDIDSELAMPGLTFSLLGGGQKMFYAGVLSGFTGRRTTESEYSGYFVGTNLGASIGPPLKIKEETLPVATNVTVGWGQFTGTNLFDDVVIVSGDFMYWGGAASGGTGRVDLPIDASATGTIYQPDGPAKQYDDKINLLRDIRDGYSSPIPSPGIFNTTLRKHGVRVGLNVFIRKGWIDTFRAKEVYSELYGD